MEQHNIRQALIGTFLNAISTKNSGDAISLLAMIGIETVLKQMTQEQDPIESDHDMLKQIEVIKKQLEMLNKQQIKKSSIDFSSPPSQQQRQISKKTVLKSKQQPQINNKQDTLQKKTDKTKKYVSEVIQDNNSNNLKKGEVFSKIAESLKPISQVNKSNSNNFRHHLDDQQMKQALVWQNTLQKSPTNPVQKQSINYFFDLKDESNYKFSDNQQDQRAVQNYSSNTERPSKKFDQPLEKKLIESYLPKKFKNQVIGENAKLHQKSNSQNQQCQQLLEFQNVKLNTGRRQPWMQVQTNNQTEQLSDYERNNQSPYFNQNQNQLQKNENRQQIVGNNVKMSRKGLNDTTYSEINRPQLYQSYQNSCSGDKYDQEIKEYLRDHTNNNTIQQKQYYSSNSNDNNSKQDDVRISGFDPTSPSNNASEQNHNIGTEQCEMNDSKCSGRSSAFSLFNPNEELRSFFQKEFQNKQELSQITLREVQVENLDIETIMRVKDSLFMKKIGGINKLDLS